MSQRVALPIVMELCSDTIFGSGFSIPGGEDVAVCQDRYGFPYVKGSTVKGLLRESLQNLAAWTNAGEEVFSLLLGEEGWPGTAEARRLRFTALTMKNPPQSPEDCYDTRISTALEGGVVKEGTLRTAACVRKGLIFSGQLECDARDVERLRDALAGIKWAGTLRNRGFGNVRFHTGTPEPLLKGNPLSAGRCIRCRLRSELPIIITDLKRSTRNSFETQGFISGGAIRGAVMSKLASEDPEWFHGHKKELLSIRFLDAVPTADLGKAPLPSIRGFYENKQESELDANVTTGADVKEGHKRAKLGSFCALENDTILYWSADTGGTMRIRRGAAGKDAAPFQVRYLNAGQEFEGYLLLDDPELASRISQAVGDTLWLGADRHAGFGKCGVSLELVKRPAWMDAYGFKNQEEIGTDLYLLAMSPFTMLDQWGDPCGLDEVQLAQKLGIDAVRVENCAASLTQNGSYNRTWQCRSPEVRMYDRGSLFHMVCSSAPTLKALQHIEEEGIGIRRAEGFGQGLFLPLERLSHLKHKVSAPKTELGNILKQAAELRRAKYRWIEKKAGELRGFHLSGSQLGTIQSLCEEAISRGGDCSTLRAHLKHNLEDRGEAHGRRFREIDALVRSTLDTSLCDTLNSSAENPSNVLHAEDISDSETARLELLTKLFNYSRKGKEEF